MRRLIGLTGSLLLVGALVLLGTGGGGSAGGYRVDAIFDSAGFLVPGQDVKIAGARVGEVTAVTLTAERRARVAMRIDEGFAPFRADADCTVQPQSLIGERFVQCTPGTAEARALRTVDGVPQVPVANTHSPVDLDLVLATFRAPAPERLRLLLSSLGAGLAGRGDDVDAIVRRANPALQQSARALAVLNANRSSLRSLVARSEDVVGELARQRRALTRFLDASGRLTATTAQRRRELRRTLRDLPGLLGEVRPYLATVRSTIDDASPTLDRLSTAAAPTAALLRRTRAFAVRARPTVRALGPTARHLSLLAPDAAPVVRRVERLTRSTAPVATTLATFLTSLRDAGGIEGAQKFLYFATAATARFDEVSHLVAAFPLVAGRCNAYATTPVKGCESHFASFPGTPSAASRRTGARGPAADTAKRRATQPPTGSRGSGPGDAPSPGRARPDRPAATSPIGSVLDAVGGLLTPQPAPPEGGRPSLPGGVLDGVLR